MQASKKKPPGDQVDRREAGMCMVGETLSQPCCQFARGKLGIAVWSGVFEPVVRPVRFGRVISPWQVRSRGSGYSLERR